MIVKLLIWEQNLKRSFRLIPLQRPESSNQCSTTGTPGFNVSSDNMEMWKYWKFSQKSNYVIKWFRLRRNRKKSESDSIAGPEEHQKSILKSGNRVRPTFDKHLSFDAGDGTKNDQDAIDKYYDRNHHTITGMLKNYRVVIEIATKEQIFLPKWNNGCYEIGLCKMIKASFPTSTKRRSEVCDFVEVRWRGWVELVREVEKARECMPECQPQEVSSSLLVKAIFVLRCFTKLIDRLTVTFHFSLLLVISHTISQLEERLATK